MSEILMEAKLVNNVATGFPQAIKDILKSVPNIGVTNETISRGKLMKVLVFNIQDIRKKIEQYGW